MVYPPDWLDRLQAAPEFGWTGIVYRHMFGDISPAAADTRGARWNPPGLEAIYTSCEAETALAEAEYYIALQPLRPKAKRTLYTIQLTLDRVLDLRDPVRLASLGVTADALMSTDANACRRVGGAVAWLHYDGLLVPSARRDLGTNLVIYRQDLAANAFAIIDSRVIAPDAR